MCFSYSVNFNKESLQSQHGLFDILIPEATFYFSGFTYPKLPVIIVENNVLISKTMQWGLLTNWIKTEEQANELRKNTLNARIETLIDKPMFRNAFKKNRCIIPASGFFEWKEINKKKYPYFIFPKSEDYFLFAGIFDTWVNPQTAEEINTYSIVTSEANEVMSEIHNTKKRMPFILNADEIKNWLNSENTEFYKSNFPSKQIQYHTISPLINSRTEDRNVPEIQKKYTYPELEQPLLF